MMAFPTFNLSYNSFVSGGSLVCSGENGEGEHAHFEATVQSDSYFRRLGAEIMLQSWTFSMDGPQIAIESHMVTERQVPCFIVTPKTRRSCPSCFLIMVQAARRSGFCRKVSR